MALSTADADVREQRLGTVDRLRVCILKELRKQTRQHVAAAADTSVFTPVGSVYVDSCALSSAITPVFAAVSPNLESGACSSAGTTPW